MSESDDFARSLLEEAKAFLEKAAKLGKSPQQEANLHASLLLAFCSLDAHISAVGDDFLERSDVTVHDKGILMEREVRLTRGRFELAPGLKMWRMEDRIEFLHHRFSGAQLDTTQAWWSALQGATNLRNKLTHPKGAVSMTVANVSAALQAIIDAIDALYRAVYKKPFPAATLGLGAQLTV